MVATTDDDDARRSARVSREFEMPGPSSTAGKELPGVASDDVVPRRRCTSDYGVVAAPGAAMVDQNGGAIVEERCSGSSRCPTRTDSTAPPTPAAAAYGRGTTGARQNGASTAVAIRTVPEPSSHASPGRVRSVVYCTSKFLHGGFHPLESAEERAGRGSPNGKEARWC